MMITLPVIGILAGVALGFRFKALVLLPANMIVALVALAAGAAHADSALHILLAAVVTMAAMQISYFAGAIIANAAKPLSTAPVVQKPSR